MATSKSKGNRVELRTFQNYGKSDIIGYKTEELDGKEYVNFIWCKVCARNKAGILSHPSLRGNTKKSAVAFIDGTNVVTKHQVDVYILSDCHKIFLDKIYFQISFYLKYCSKIIKKIFLRSQITRHLDESAGHQIAVQLEKAKPVQEVGRIDNQFLAGPSQPRIDVLQESASREAYLKLIRTAYELALHPTTPLSNFKILVKCQRMNGVRLIDGKDDGKSVGEYIDCIAKAVEEKVAAVLVSKNAMSLLSDGSQARKTGADKEMVLIRVERFGKSFL